MQALEGLVAAIQRGQYFNDVRRNLGIREAGVSLFQVDQRFFVLAALVQYPAEAVDDRWAVGVVLERLADQFLGLAVLVGAVGERITQRIEGHRAVGPAPGRLAVDTDRLVDPARGQQQLTAAQQHGLVVGAKLDDLVEQLQRLVIITRRAQQTGLDEHDVDSKCATLLGELVQLLERTVEVIHLPGHELCGAAL